MPSYLRVIFSLLIIWSFVASPISWTFADTAPETIDIVVPSETQPEAQSEQTSEDLKIDTIQASTYTNLSTSSATSTIDVELPTEISVGDIESAEDSSVPTPQATTSQETEAPGADTLQSLSTLLAGFFDTESEQKNLLMSETLPIYDLDQPIRIHVTPQMAIVIKEEPTTLFEHVVDEMREWFEADTPSFGESQDEPEVDATVPDSSADSPDEAGGEVESVYPEPATDSEVGDTEEAPPSGTEEVDSAESADVSEPSAYRMEAYCRWWELLCTLNAHAQGEETALEILDSVPPEESIVEVATSTPAQEEEASNTANSGETIEMSTLEPTQSTSTEMVSDAMADIATTTQPITVTPLVSLGTTSIAAELIKNEAGQYEVVIPPGGLPFGIHELVVATSTVDGDIYERVVVDYGGGYVRQIHLDAYGTLLVTTNEEGKQALWLWQESESGVSVHNLVLYGEYTQDSPIGLFDDFLFYLSSDGRSFHGYDLVSGVTFSHSVEVGRNTIKTPLRSGEYHIILDEHNFQFVSVVDAIY